MDDSKSLHEKQLFNPNIHKQLVVWSSRNILNDIFCDQFETCQEIGDFLASGKRQADGTVLEIIRIERSLVIQKLKNDSSG